MSSNHSIHLREEYLELIRNGAKTIEGRINRTPYSDINQGDIVRLKTSSSKSYYYCVFTRLSLKNLT